MAIKSYNCVEFAEKVYADLYSGKAEAICLQHETDGESYTVDLKDEDHSTVSRVIRLALEQFVDSRFMTALSITLSYQDGTTDTIYAVDEGHKWMQVLETSTRVCSIHAQRIIERLNQERHRCVNSQNKESVMSVTTLNPVEFAKTVFWFVLRGHDRITRIQFVEENESHNVDCTERATEALSLVTCEKLMDFLKGKTCDLKVTLSMLRDDSSVHVGTYMPVYEGPDNTAVYINTIEQIKEVIASFEKHHPATVKSLVSICDGAMKHFD